jgi:hypothetical protein
MAEDVPAMLSARRFGLGIASFVAAFLTYPVTGAFIFAGAGPRTLAIVMAINFILNKLFLLGSVIILGRAGFNRLKGQVFGALRDYLMPDEVGPWRYRIGLVMFVLPLVFAWKAPYVTELMPILGRHTIEKAAITDVMLIASLFVLGGGFWDKIRALFVREATVAFPAR